MGSRKSLGSLETFRLALKKFTIGDFSAVSFDMRRVVPVGHGFQ
jgi:hypothetical protein